MSVNRGSEEGGESDGDTEPELRKAWGDGGEKEVEVGIKGQK